MDVRHGDNASVRRTYGVHRNVYVYRNPLGNNVRQGNLQ